MLLVKFLAKMKMIKTRWDICRERRNEQMEMMSSFFNNDWNLGQEYTHNLTSPQFYSNTTWHNWIKNKLYYDFLGHWLPDSKIGKFIFEVYCTEILYKSHISLISFIHSFIGIHCDNKNHIFACSLKSYFIIIFICWRKAST